MATDPSSPRRAAIWARVSSSDQHTENQLPVLRKWAADRGMEVAAEFITEDSAWTRSSGNGKGAEFDKARAALIEGAHLGRYEVVLVWHIDRLTRRGYKDLSGLIDRLKDYGCALESYEQPELGHIEGWIASVIVHIYADVAKHESDHKSRQIRAGLARRRTEGKPVGRQPGSKDKAKRKRSGYVARWERERARKAATTTEVTA